MDNILVGIMMGSDSDIKIMSEAAKILEKLGIGYEMKIISAHRTPEKAIEYATGAKARGLKVIIAGAGAAAHLPGVIAALTTLPVVGVPIKSQALSGVDSLYSIVQMPSGIPVATVAIDGALNAGLLAARIIGAYDDKIANKLKEYKDSLNESVCKKDDKLGRLGYEAYIAGM